MNFRSVTANDTLQRLELELMAAGREDKPVRMKVILVLFGALVGAMALYAGIKVFPIYYADSLFTENLRLHARMISGRGNSSSEVRDFFYRDAQRHNIPLDRENLKVEFDPTGGRVNKVTADYDVPVDLYFFQPALHFHSQYPEDKQAQSRRVRRIVTTLGLLLGLYWFCKGLVIFRRYRVVADTPIAPIRSIAMGLVKVRGEAVGERALVSPVSKTPCFLYRVTIEQWKGDGRSGLWAPYLTDAGWVQFYIQDESGKVLIDPRGATYDLEQTTQVHVAKSPGALLGHAWEDDERSSDAAALPASSSELRRYILRAASGIRTSLFQGADLSRSGFVGSQQEKPRGFMGLPATLLVDFLLRKTSPLGVGSNRLPGDYRLTERCILPNSLYEILGTCTENRDAPSEIARQVIAKGENAPTLLISHQSDADLEETLRSRALRHVLGGGAMAIGFAAALLESLGYL